MSVLGTVLFSHPFIYFPQTSAGRLIAVVGWVIYLVVTLVAIRHWRIYNVDLTNRSRWIYIGLAISVPITNLFIGLSLPTQGALTPPNLALELPDPALMFFAAVPFLLAGGMFGPLAAATLGAFSGILQAIWDTHSIFTPLELALVGVLFSAAVKQRYRSGIFRFLRHPLVAALLMVLMYPFINVLSNMLAVDGSLAIRLDYAFTQLRSSTLAMSAEIFIAGLVAEVVAAAVPSLWKSQRGVIPSPPEKSLEARFVYTVVPFALLLVILLIAGNWIVAEGAALRMVQDRMVDTAEIASDGIPYFLNTGQSLILSMADDPRLIIGDKRQVKNALADHRSQIPYFTQLYVLDHEGEMMSGDPEGVNSGSRPLQDERAAIESALDGLPYQEMAVMPENDETAAGVIFIVPLVEEEGEIHRVLVGRTDLDVNPMSKPILNILDGVNSVGALLDENDRIVYYPKPELLMDNFSFEVPEGASFIDETAPDGTRSLVYYKPVPGKDWTVVITVPAQQTQQLALSIALPLIAMIFFLALFSWFLLRFSLRRVTGSLQSFAIQARSISQGDLDGKLPALGEDEVGQLRQAFEQMRLSLKARLDELNLLLLVSQGVASSLDVGDSVKPVLEAALSTGASSARVVLAPSTVPDLSSERAAQLSYALGPASEIYRDLDEQIFNLTRQQDQIVLTNLSRTRAITFIPGAPRPKSLLAIALRHENRYYGTFWIAHDEHHLFSEEEVRFLATLAGYAALAIANARLFLNAEVGRQRLSAILASTPDPVLVTDQQNRLLLANPAAWRVLGIGVEWEEGWPIERVISQRELLQFLRSSNDEKRLEEITLPDGRVFFAYASTIMAEGKQVGRVCVLRDVTQFKELDALKSEFVATVSHDLRSPLTLIRGYASMLDMVGDLNEQQSGYVLKIVNGVDSMSHLVNNLLDLGRIEAGIGLQLEMLTAKDMIDRVVRTLQVQATQRRVSIKIQLSQSTMPSFKADPALLGQALQNLVDNAIKYTEPGGQVQIGANMIQDRIVFEVRDTGIGIAPVDQPRLFEKFYRSTRQTAQQSRGTGLGLAIVKSIAERHGGQVWVESQLGKGSVFYLAIPLRNREHANVG